MILIRKLLLNLGVIHYCIKPCHCVARLDTKYCGIGTKLIWNSFVLVS